LQLLKERFQAFLNGETQIVADEAFCNAVRSYYEVSLRRFVLGILMLFERLLKWLSHFKKLTDMTGSLRVCTLLERIVGSVLQFKNS
jgi:hypothetical protein